MWGFTQVSDIPIGDHFSHYTGERSSVFCPRSALRTAQVVYTLLLVRSEDAAIAADFFFSFFAQISNIEEVKLVSAKQEAEIAAQQISSWKSGGGEIHILHRHEMERK